MKKPIYAIRDNKTGFLAPMMDDNDSAAMRNFEHAMVSTRNLFLTHPEDYELFKIGDFDTDKGTLKPCTPVSIITALQAKERMQLNG